MKNLTAGLIFIVLGVLFMLDNLDIADFGYMIRHYWPLILIIWGLSMLMKRGSATPPSGTAAESKIDSELVHESNVFGGISLNIASKNFKGGSVSAVFGSCWIDLTQSTVAEGEHVLRLNSVFGDTVVMLSKETAVSISASAMFGELNILDQRKSGISSDLQTSTPDYSASPNRLKVTVSQVFGNVKII